MSHISEDSLLEKFVKVKSFFAASNILGKSAFTREEITTIFDQCSPSAEGRLSTENIDLILQSVGQNEDGKYDSLKVVDWIFSTTNGINQAGLQTCFDQFELQGFIASLVRRLHAEKYDDPFNIICAEAAAWRPRWRTIFETLTDVSDVNRGSESFSSYRKPSKDIELSGEKEEAWKAVCRSVSKFQELSDKISKLVKDHRFPGGKHGRQDVFFRGSGLPKLLKQSETVKPAFESLGRKIAENIRKRGDFGSNTYFLAGPAKAKERAEAKTKVNYLNDASRLKDTVRGTLVLELPGNAVDCPNSVVEKAYRAFQNILETLRSQGAHALHFDDRYLKPLGEYRDWKFLVELQGLVCELQVNFDVAIQKKEGTQHRDFEQKRLADETLLEAAMTNDIPQFLTALKDGGDVNMKDQINEMTALHYATANGDKFMTELLIEKSANVLAMDVSGQLPINRPLVKNFLDVVDVLLQEMSDAKMSHYYDVMPDSGKISILAAISAAAHNRLDKEMKLLELIVSSVFPDLKSMLLFAARSGLTDVVKWTLYKIAQGKKPEEDSMKIFHGDHCLYNLGNDVNAFFLFRPDVSFGDVCALDEAVLAGSKKCAEELIKVGAQFHPQGPHQNPQERALQYAKEDEAERLNTLIVVDHLKPRHLDNFAGKPWGARNPDGSPRLGGEWGTMPGTPLDLDAIFEMAAKHNSKNSIHSLIAMGRRVSDEKNSKILSVFWAAVGRGDRESVEVLIRARVDVNATGHCGRTALWIACTGSTKGHCQILKDLIETGADVNTTDTFGRSALSAACFNGRLEIVKILCSKGVNLHRGDEASSYPACVAACSGRLSILLALYEAGMDVTKIVSRTYLGEIEEWSVAHSAARSGSRRCLHFLWQTVGIDLLKQNDDGEWKFLKVAMESPYSTAFAKVQEYLLEISAGTGGWRRRDSGW